MCVYIIRVYKRQIDFKKMIVQFAVYDFLKKIVFWNVVQERHEFFEYIFVKDVKVRVLQDFHKSFVFQVFGEIDEARYVKVVLFESFGYFFEYAWF